MKIVILARGSNIEIIFISAQNFTENISVLIRFDQYYDDKIPLLL